MSDDAQRPFAQVIAKAWSDADFKQRLLADPRAALAEIGVQIPAALENMTLKVVENTADTLHLVLPAPPAEGELDDAALDGVVGGPTPAYLTLSGANVGDTSSGGDSSDSIGSPSKSQQEDSIQVQGFLHNITTR